ncbi:hypothetical protein C5167_040683, partial [Papaver somniferum]
MNFSNVRVLSLSYSAISELPPSIAKLKHLRYLNLSNSQISKLPNSFTTLYNLQTLILKNCFELRELPRGMRKLTNLRNLIICKIGNEWSHPVLSISSSFPCVRQLKVKVCRKLMIMPTRFPSLKVLEFEDCNGEIASSLLECNVTSLAYVYNCEKLQGINPYQDAWDEEEEEEQLQLHSSISLNTLIFYNCPALFSWPDLRGFISLRMLFIYGCKSQQCIPSGIEYLPKLERLVMGGFSKKMDLFPFPTAEGTLKSLYFPSLRNLEIYGWPKLRCLPDQVQYLTSLQTLWILGFESLIAMPEWLGNLTSLRELKIHWCGNLKYMPYREQMLRLTSLQHLHLVDCHLLVDRCKEGGEEYNKTSHIPKFTYNNEGLAEEVKESKVQ